MLVVGTGQLAQDFADRVETHPGLGLRIVGPPLERPRSRSRSSRDRSSARSTTSRSVFREQVVDEVAICLPPAASRLLEPIASVASGEGKTVRIAVDPIEEILPSAVQEEFDGIIVRSLVNDGQREAALILKRLIDVVGAAVGLVASQPDSAGRRGRPPAARRLTGPLPPGARRPPRPSVHDAQVPHDGGRTPRSDSTRCAI